MRLLIIEDERDLAEALKQGLAHHGFAVDLAHDGEQGLALAKTYPYDGIVLDRMLPRLDGLEVCRQLRAGGQAVPIMMLTAKDTVADRVDGLNAGADDYLIKPFAFQELLARVRALTRRHTPARQNLLQAHDLALNLNTGEVSRRGQALALTRKEYMLLAYLLQHPGQLLSPEQILEHAWDFDAEPTAETVRTHIKNLRKKVDQGFEPKLIKTVHGMGYKLEA